MKLLNKTTYYYILASIPIYLLTSFLFLFVAKKLNIYHVDANLKEDKNNIIQEAKNVHPIHIESELSHDYIIKRIPKDSLILESIITVELYDSDEDEYESYRELVTIIDYENERYEIVLRKSLVENGTLLYSLTLLFIVLLPMSLGVFLLVNRFIARKMWEPFYVILKRIQDFQLSGEKEFHPTKTDIIEFRQLNEVFETMVVRIEKDYKSQKEFIDIMSHELQTPLSIVMLNVENLIQSADLKKDEVKCIETILSTALRMSKMNQSLLLLSRINNFQYNNQQKVLLAPIVREHLEIFQVMIEDKQLELMYDLDDKSYSYVDPVLADILIGNLIQNAVRHNVLKGRIKIQLYGSRLVIKNSGTVPTFSDKKVFEKFIKSDKKESIGLGLSIVKGICEAMSYQINYSFIESKSMYRVEVVMR